MGVFIDLLVIVVLVFGGVAWGKNVEKIAESKGHIGEGWFWKGFFLGRIGEYMASQLMNVDYDKYKIVDIYNANNKEKEIEPSKESTGKCWKCVSCGTYNPSYEEMCICGNSKSKNEQDKQIIIQRENSYRNKRKTQEKSVDENLCDKTTIDGEKSVYTNKFAKENERINLIVKYKKLMDEGAITEEEYNKKKMELLESE